MKFQTVSMDTIAIMSEEELGKTTSKLESLIITAGNDKDRKQLEKEHCYYMREREVRDHRQKAHARYVETVLTNKLVNS
jgi:hypothetical protein